MRYRDKESSKNALEMVGAPTNYMSYEIALDFKLALTAMGVRHSSTVVDSLGPPSGRGN